MTQIDHHHRSGDRIDGFSYTWNPRNLLKGMNFLPDGTGGIADYSAEDVKYSYEPRGASA